MTLQGKRYIPPMLFVHGNVAHGYKLNCVELVENHQIYNFYILVLPEY